ncbi:hypothetical protein [Massilia yuzhufengensis]|uniref:Uncharacterized protein n=1 Tax=Massilia yuzhufengensis TaxID=1164594 RepID=A0A1I1FQ55_9BURK|nr:hypothetical protein [Massilia yuzhufengensis]SFC01587.1 hypothetical protein SAMN05216204_10370 [Massilia yuzhufengensis]
MTLRRFTAIALLPAAALSMLPMAAAAAPPFQALPAGGALDGARVIESRYGPAPAPAREQAQASAAEDAPKAAPVAAIRIPGALATLVLESTGAATDSRAPLTFGQVFGPGVLRPGERLQAMLPGAEPLPLQLDVKALHPDGSVRHAVVSGVLPQPAQGKPMAFGLAKAAPPKAGKAGEAGRDSLAAALRGGADASVQLTLGDKTYTASLARLLAQGKPASWLDGPVVHEWHAAAPLSGPGGEAHPHLAARFALRWYPALGNARIDVTIENNWAYEPAPQNFTYDVRLSARGQERYAKQGLTHFHHARWRKVFWLGATPAVHLRHDTRQLIASMAVPNYDQSVTVSDKTLSGMYAQWNGPKTEPMGVGQAHRSMPATGGRPDIGLMPAWSVMYLLSMDRRAAEITLGTASLAGSWSIHYRDQKTGLPVSLLDYPYMTVLGKASDTRNPATGKSEAFPACTAPGACLSPNAHDIPHQPAFSYLPYLLTGDHYDLEELQFWAMYDVFASNPGYRENRRGLLKPDQVRGQAWALRTLGEAAYITPDQHPLKRHFLQILDSNLDWYNAAYTDDPHANALGIITNGYAVGYAKKRGVAPWQDDFFTSAVGHLAELGFGKARKLLAWKAKFPMLRMTAEGMCWINASMYAINVRDSASAPIYPNMAQAYRASTYDSLFALPCAGAGMAAALKLQVGEMVGYSSVETGFPSNMQPALAYAADALGEPGKKAWQQFMARSVKPDYGRGPQFAIVPR